MIKVTIGESKAQFKHFPKLMKSTKTTLQVFFTEPGIGIVAVAGNDYDISHYSSDWAMCSFTDIEEATPGAVKDFPKLMKANEGFIVLFNRPEVGTVVCAHSTWEIGYRSNCFPMEQFTDFNGSITLQNS
jgi:hypothetical protein